MLKVDSWSAKVRIALSESTWVVSTVLPSRSRAWVVAKLASAVVRKELPESMMVARSSPVPANPLPSSRTVVRSEGRSIELTVVDRLASSSSVGSGVSVSASAICEPSSSTGPSSLCGWSSTYCSPTADRLPTTARVSAGMSS